MKHILFLLSILPLAISCSKDSDSDPGPGLDPDSEIGYPREWVFTIGGESNVSIDPSVAEYEYIYTNGSAMFRDNILKSYPLKDLVDEKDCLWFVSESRTFGGKKSYTIQLNNSQGKFLGIGQSSNKEEYHLYIAKGIEVVVVGNPSHLDPPSGDDGGEYLFYIHKMPSVNGVTTVALESAGMPGWYVTDASPGFNFAQNVVTFQKEDSPEEAPKWQCRSAK